MPKQTHYQRLTIANLRSLAADRFGSLASAAMMAERECQGNESTIRNKAPWIRCLEKPLNPEDLGHIASHETWAAQIRRKIVRSDRSSPVTVTILPSTGQKT